MHRDRRSSCRVCGSRRLSIYLNLGVTPLANSYLRPDDLSRPEFMEELALQACRDCGLSQLSRVVSPDRMFRKYLYASSTPKTFRRHCDELARTLISRASLRKGEQVLDIGSNDGCLLSQFRRRGMKVLGVDPAHNLSAEANRRHIPTLCRYWSIATAQDILSRWGAFPVVTSTNVLAHVDDVHQFVEAVTIVLAPRGLWVVEVPYLLDFIRRNEFDTAYHEHVSYFSVHALNCLMTMHGLEIIDLKAFPELHGGTLRLLIARSGVRRPAASVMVFLDKEGAFGLKTKVPFHAFARRVNGNRTQFVRLLRRLRQKRHVIWAYGASAKGNTLMSFYSIPPAWVPVAIDDNPRKWGYFTPGSHMRITDVGELKRTRVDYLLLLAWNFKDEIMRRCRAAGYQGRFILPVPRARIL